VSEMIRVADRLDVKPGTAIAVDVGGTSVAIFNVGGRYYAIGNACSHHGAPLCQGTVQGDKVRCPLHSAEFDLTTGDALSPPAAGGTGSYKVVIEGEDLKISI
jgi:nitrite reductase/ring-hydroxylating ferredoxin subunit